MNRVSSGCVTVRDEKVSEISTSRGLLALIGCARDDTTRDAEWLAHKLSNMRLFESDTKKWDVSAAQLHYEILVVSNFTLSARMKGNKPAFESAMEPSSAQELYSHFLSTLQALHPAAVKGAAVLLWCFVPSQ